MGARRVLLFLDRRRVPVWAPCQLQRFSNASPNISGLGRRLQVPKPRRRLPVALFIGAGAAGAVSVLGIAYWANRNGYVQDCRDAVATGRTCSNLSTLEGQRTLGFVTASVGLAATAGLVVGALLTRGHDDAPVEGVSVSCAPGGLSLVCSGRF